MGIEQQMEFDFGFKKKEETLENPDKAKLAIAEQYLIVPTEENLAKLEEREGQWYFGVLKVEEWEELHMEKDTYWK